MLNKIIFILSLLLSTNLQAGEINKSQILFLLRSNHNKEALNLYNEYKNELKSHDIELIQEMGLLLLDQGFASSDPENKIMTIFGAGISLNEKALHILEKGIESPAPEIQLISLNFLEQFQHDLSERLMQKAMTTSHPLVKLEIAYLLARKKAPRAFSYAESLMYRHEDILMPLFPKFFALIGNKESKQMLKKLMSNQDEKVRIASILETAHHSYDDLLPRIRMLSSHGGKAQQEACCYALGVLKDSSSINKLKLLSLSNQLYVQLAASKALYLLGEVDYKRNIEIAAKTEDPFAIYLLSEIEGSSNILIPLLRSPNLQTRLNATYSLLAQKNTACLQELANFLVIDSKGILLSKMSTPGCALTALKATPSGKQNFKDNPLAFEVSLSIREDLLEESFHLQEEAFLQLAKLIFVTCQNDLVPLLTNLLEENKSPKAIALLKEHQQQIGAPLIRGYCNLALYNSKEKGPFADNIHQWVSLKQNEELIRFRPFLPRELREKEDHYQLTPEDSSALLIASFESFISKRDERGIDTLLEAILNGNKKNRYALAGLLMRLVQ